MFYSFLSDRVVTGIIIQPVLARGVGEIITAESVSFGVERSPLFFSTYIYLDVRRETGGIYIGKNTFINNNASIISDGCKIRIGDNCLIGTNVQIIDSDFHDLNPSTRFGGSNVLRADVNIMNNVFIGNNVTVLKGVTVGDNSVIASGSIVSSHIPANVIAAGVPAKVVRSI